MGQLNCSWECSQIFAPVVFFSNTIFHCICREVQVLTLSNFQKSIQGPTKHLCEVVLRK